ncbi:SDR family oxidoreductase [Ketogulonicigenium vulgare]|uniref:Carveol dehydrogenase ((+)-trans-carveol dehydrogenase) n=1 Tax=Ketogulonicigenium vulgare (strain WSH-001) TaxID=759362 RepID=F9Y569_KETVW|nr:SDR family oxidoreductase [Ketogulonicigenium vulgare]ADO43602.1 carveol dehydrogenase [Ketogulonicigenium vulgare Y25]AEM41874.1 Carveol dehydrogenase ((+)-trans-carveol dehydrogenase) [Ketogulonicigenium vulgare WSH-001]ALJ81982.1 carveol dehydrogenase [Ketogulonicigenium vulgare]ANW34619.1 carveol dehydrogenase [Ketogulonicigenium vulgare]AOZ55635.1 carveol dehydrogenase [Ketogulonicigenium vulgare]
MSLLQGKTFFVTGAAGGIGAATVTRLLAEGANVIASDRWDAETRVSANLLQVPGDVTSRADMRAAVAAGVAAFGTLDGGFLNAGVCLEGGLFDGTDAVFDLTMDVNVKGVFQSASAVAEVLAEKQSGSLVLTSSISGLRGAARFMAYAASKHAVVGLMRSFAQQLGPLNIRVNTVHPTSVRTPMVDDIAHARRTFQREDATMDDLMALYKQRHLMPIAWVEPEEIANAVAWLLSDQARFVTGNTLTIDAGTCVK